jgi:hypothetical protein
MGASDEDLDYAYLATLDEALMLSIEHIEAVRHADSPLVQGVHLKMASRALRCALELYGEKNNEHVHDYPRTGSQPVH